MGVIRQLPPSVVNQIAAGEVVERPSSVVKELLENAIDAGATRVDVSVERGGKDLVRIADNGCGMGPEDLHLAFQPHATSKLADVEDLYRVRTLGFRGEALAAIAEVSRVRCQTRQAGADEGSEIQIEAGIAGPIKRCGIPVGTIMEVRNLFFNVPVRRTFLKSDQTEAGHVTETFWRIALAHPEVHLTFRSGGKVLHDLPPVTGMRDRIAVFFGRELAESLLWVEGELERIHLWGYVAHPSQSRSSTKGQYLFLGGRYVRDRSLGHALGEAYRGLLMVGRNPVAFLHLEIPPEEVDVNVHPTKIEVRFRDPQRIYSHLLSTLRQTFLTSDLHSRLQAAQDQPAAAGPARTMAQEPAASIPTDAVGVPDFDRSGRAPDRSAVASWFDPSRSAPGAGASPGIPESLGQAAPPEWARALPSRFEFGPGDEFDEFTSRVAAQAPPAAPTASAGLDASAASVVPTTPAAGGTPATADPASLKGPLKAIQVHDSYLIAETADGMMVIDQHALHERIIYEELRQRVAEGRVESQGLLVPEPVHLAADEAAAVLDQKDVLAGLGLEIEPFGGDTVVIRSTPAMLGHLAPDRLLRDLAEHLQSSPIPPTRDALVAEILHMVSCKAAVKAGDKLEPDEIAALLARRHLVADSHHCPHGRPTALVFTKAELEKQFGRI
ncbi:DNA mismatch repair protein MutL [Aquisphaera giovannonii]|uniref:DNA mismatch repair protein MutL n=1 Tax=Aquisphaera giovannonii TaxID=406548 RepID=A0A5B9WAB1_9BACT|nr:DNA mismatch repair endonuclease MutL [Aquisphaera giovannonii]QEH36800.1 DNA mismatch repair protein MutL [Aquisphaera giovannonii]